MSSLERIDVHTHAFHPKIASKVLRQLESHYHIPPVGNGLLDDLCTRLDKAHIAKCLVHSAATTPEQVIPANRWAVSLLDNPRVIPFGTMHPLFGNMENELQFLYEKGVRGLKLHPDFQGFRLDDPALLPLFGAMEGSFTLLVHVGDKLPPDENPSCPWKIAAIKRKFPKLRIVAAHFGGLYQWQYVPQAYHGLEIFLDTSSTLFAIPAPLLKQIYNAFPRYRFLFGSDYPLFDPSSEMIRLQQRLRISDNEIEELLTAGSRLDLDPRPMSFFQHQSTFPSLICP